MNLFVAKLSPSITGEELQELFSQYGEVASAKVIFDKETGNSKGYGFVEMPNTDEAKSAIDALNESEIDGKQIVVKEANDRVEKPRRDFQRSGGFKPRSGGGGGGFQRRDDNRGGGRDDRRGGGGSGGGNRRNDNRNRGGGGGGYERENNWY
jgi:RNA recognition motif-containing protein